MNWRTALEFARNQEDLTYEEWCGLYVDNIRNPKRENVERALKVARPILVRNQIIEESVELSFYG